MKNWMIVLGGIASAISLLVFFVSVGSLRGLPDTPDDTPSHGRHILKYRDGAKALVIVLGTLLPASVLYIYATGSIDVYVALFTLAIDALFVGYCGPEFFRTRIEFNADHVYTFSAWRKPRVIPWTVIMAHKYSTSRRWDIFDTFGYGSLRVSDFMQGKDEFIAKFKQYGEESLDYRHAHSAA